MQLDLRPEELRKYQGISPCPADIDAFSDGEIARMKALDPKAELQKALIIRMLNVLIFTLQA